MFDYLSKKRKKSQWELPDIETVLQSSLKPISPRPEFIQSLHRGLMEYSFPDVEQSSLALNKSVIFAILGLVSIIFIFSLWIRLIVVIITTLGMLQVSKRKKDLPKISAAK
jgi:hypothetical protein